jgi:hypothetical protein
LHAWIVFHFLISCFLFSCSISVLLYFIADVPAAKRAGRATGTVCDACRENFASFYAFDKHRSSLAYLIGNPCFVLDDGSTQTNLVSTERVTMSTMSTMLQKLKVAFSIHFVFIKKETMKLPAQIRTSMHICILRRGTAHDPLQSIFY